jgi:hypothetical protein
VLVKAVADVGQYTVVVQWVALGHCHIVIRHVAKVCIERYCLPYTHTDRFGAWCKKHVGGY